MFRLIARAQLREGLEAEGAAAAKQEAAVLQLIRQGEIMTAGCFMWKRNVFIYCECVHRMIGPEELVPDMAPYLEEWPGQPDKRKWIPMMDVFHFNEPAGYDHWLRKGEVERRVGRVAPSNWSDSRMDLHFQPWEDGHLYFKPVEQLFACYCGDLLNK
ncbi:hypothetical protein [Paenibacillus prosopidis]|uniref:Uncharacterized protein n=1 Tax=Paenibacillus prosopidis TaxID=630520 RepID=A0A368VUQ9_9BACL|nr:hypothetical protein [Paenibacillus prosopidis]RCW44971.1 hypothetical protein DFP97_111198 [Paenibacillus prosopidis]